MNVGLVLAGGGARGVAHLGVLKAIDEEGITVQAISGVSAGAIVGALYSYGYSPEYILEQIEALRIIGLIKPSFSGVGVMRMDKVQAFLEKFIKVDSFENLKIPLSVVATDVGKGKSQYFDKGQLIAPILCSSCIPVVFKPIRYKNKSYIDGGVLDNFPVKPLKKTSKIIIGSDCNYATKGFVGKGLISIVERSLLLAINSDTKSKKKYCHINIETPRSKHYGVFDFKKASEIFELGYNEAKKQIASYKQIIHG